MVRRWGRCVGGGGDGNGVMWGSVDGGGWRKGGGWEWSRVEGRGEEGGGGE